MSSIIHGPEGPFSSQYQDIFFSTESGLEESRHVFLGGNNLPQAWAGREHFRIGELGFGSGLNILALGDLWRKHPGSPALEVHSLERVPWSREDLAKVYRPWSELNQDAEILNRDYDATGKLWIGHFEWGVLTVHHGDASEVLANFPGQIDAWFLDGFAPDRNPDLWTKDLLNLVFTKTGSGGTAATYSAAGSVKRALREVGFTVTRAPGFGKKRHMVKALKPG